MSMRSNMPPKHKLHKTTGKMKIIPAPSPLEPSTSNEAFDTNSEAAQQFEIELCWCIQQLQTTLKSGKLNQKQVQDNTKALNTLMSNSAPLIKKRQVMRMTFGDYRNLMAIEDRRFRSANTKIQLSSAAPSKNSVFIKKSVFSKMSGNGFKFNFPEPKNVDITDLVSNINIGDRTTTPTNDTENQVASEFHFAPSENAFKFNFNVDNND